MGSGGRGEAAEPSSRQPQGPRLGVGVGVGKGGEGQGKRLPPAPGWSPLRLRAPSPPLPPGSGAARRVGWRRAERGAASGGMEEHLPWETDGRESAALRGRGGAGRGPEHLPHPPHPHTPAGATPAGIGSVHVSFSVLGSFVAPRGTCMGPRGHWPRAGDISSQ